MLKRLCLLLAATFASLQRRLRTMRRQESTIATTLARSRERSSRCFGAILTCGSKSRVTSGQAPDQIWEVEFGSVNTVERLGVARDSVQVGDRVSVSGSLGRNGRPSDVRRRHYAVDRRGALACRRPRRSATD